MAKRKSNPKKKATASKPQKKQKLEEMSYLDGIQEDVDEIKNLEDLLGVNQINPYKTRSLAVFEEKLMDMNLSDLQELAVTVGVFPSGTKNSLRTKLKKQFVADTRGGGVQVVKSKQRKLDPSDPKQAETIRLMREGL
tara:strand:- start:29518 stop:29931 length:414 start_codon:yes stop_codon:yes gene_type:complete